MRGHFLHNCQYGDAGLSAMPCYEELNPAPILHEHVYSHITIPQLMEIYPSLNGYQQKPPLTVEHIAALRSAEANEFAAKQVPDLRTRLERQQAATLRAKEALAAEEQKCKELQAQLDAQPPPTGREALEKEKQAVAAEKQALEERDAALRAAMKEFNAKVEALAAREATMEEKEDGERGGEVPEELKNVAAEVKPFDSTATIRKQIDEQQALLTDLYHIFEGVDVDNCKFKITHVAQNLLVLEGNASTIATTSLVNTLRRRLSGILGVNAKDIKMATFNNILSVAVGCPALPTINRKFAMLQQMGIATDRIAHAAFGQHFRNIHDKTDSVTYCAIRGIAHAPFKRNSPLCSYVLRGGVLQCPNKAKRAAPYCSRHLKRPRM
jgi:hypothetical protein